MSVVGIELASPGSESSGLTNRPLLLFENLATLFYYLHLYKRRGGLVVRTLDTEPGDVSSIPTTDINFTLVMFDRLCECQLVASA